jgi:FkbM family methyltransferase
MLAPMLSYAQNAEDVVLRRTFADVEQGFYIDIGAGHPLEDSVTHYFYERGWSGINIEPDAPLHAELTAARVRDINLCVAVGSRPGEITYYPTGTRGHGTVDAKLAAERKPGPEPRSVPNIALSRIFEEHTGDQPVHFLKIDVEGAEEDVIASGNFDRHRPFVVVVEATDAEGCPTQDGWEPRLLKTGYVFALFDGLNRFYCCREQAQLLLPRLSIPANIFDNYRLAREARASDALLARAESEAARAYSLEQTDERLDRELREVAEARATLQQQVDQAAEALATLQRQLQEAAAARERLEQEHNEARQELQVAKADNDRLLTRSAELDELLAQERVAHDLTKQQRDEANAQTRLLVAERDRCAERLRVCEGALAQECASHDGLKAQLRSLKSSPSWRLTKTVRMVTTLANMLRRGG